MDDLEEEDILDPQHSQMHPEIQLDSFSLFLEVWFMLEDQFSWASSCLPHKSF